MAYLAFYRTFRPTTFDEVVRQEHIVKILKNQIETDKVGHAYLFCGPRGTGKTTLAKIFARAINCNNPVNGSPCGKCSACKSLAEGSNLDVSEIDAASNNGVDEMRDLREKVQYPPVAGKYKVYIIDEVHMLTASAFNAVLKTLEEPPRHAVFILATTEPQKIPATILSRCMRFDFKLIPQKDLEELIRGVFVKTGKQFEEAAVSAIARAGAGSARDSLSIADMCASYSQGKLTYEDVNAVLGGTEYSKIADICGAILNEDVSSALNLTEEILSTGKSVGVLVKDMLSFLNNCTIVKVCKSAREIVNLPDETYKKIEDAAKSADPHKLLRVTEVIARAETDLRYSLNGRITLETAVLKCAIPQIDYDIDALIGKINALEKKIESGVPITVAAPQTVKKSQQSAPPVREYAANNEISAEKPVKTLPQVQKTQKAEEEEQPYKKPAAKPAIILNEDDGESPFGNVQNQKPVNTEEGAGEGIQPTLWEDGGAGLTKVTALREEDKGKIFGKFMGALRKTHKNAVLFTLCMDLDHAFEGDKMVLITDSETVYRGLLRESNAKFVADLLAEFGVFSHEVRLKAKGESEYEKAVGELRRNFDGADITEK